MEFVHCFLFRPQHKTKCFCGGRARVTNSHNGLVPKVASRNYGRCSDASVSSSEYERLKHRLGKASRWAGICEKYDEQIPPRLLPTPPHPLTFSCRCWALGFTKVPIFLLRMAVVDDDRCRPYVAEWGDIDPTWYALPT